MSDGANMGVRAGRALKTILGDEPVPTEGELLKADEFEFMIRSRPLPPDIKTEIWDDPKLDDDERYSYAAECIAHAFLVLADEDPEILTRQLYYPTEAPKAWTQEEWDKHGLAGAPRSLDDGVWEALTKRWPEYDDKIGGATGFMVGWAFNAARKIKNLNSTPNPAIIEIDIPEGDS